MYWHPIGHLSRGAVLDVGLKCTHSCKFCYYSYLDQSRDQFRGMRRASFRSMAECKEILLRLKTQGFLNVDVTGGEPTLHPHIIELMRYAHQDLGLVGRIITLGQFLMRRMPHGQRDRLLDDLLDAGLVNFLLSVHAVEPELFERITGEAWAPLHAAMQTLDQRPFWYTTNTTVFDWNYPHLPALARELMQHRIYLHNFIIMNAYYAWNRDGRAFGVQARYRDISPYLSEAVGILESAGIVVNIRYAPLCAVRGLEKHLVGMVGVRHDPYEWMNQAGHLGGSPAHCATRLFVQDGQIEPHLHEHPIRMVHENRTEIVGMRGHHLKHFVKACDSCAARTVCDGIDPNYLKLYGDKEFTPYTSGIWTPPLHPLRAAYPQAFVVKTHQDEPMRDICQMVAQAPTASAPVPPQSPPLIMPTSAKSTPPPPKTSVVITCFNYGRYLTEAVDSVLAQTDQDFELIIVNDGSTDDTQSIAEHLVAAHPTHRIRLLTQPNSGQPALARNAGIRLAQGDYLLCLDADDKLAPTMLEACRRVLDTLPKIGIAYTDRRDFDGVNQIIRAADYHFSRLRYENHLSYCALFRKQAWVEVGGYRDNVRGCEDWDFWIACGARGYAGMRVPEPLFWYRRHDTGVYQEALKHFEQRTAQIRLNNREVYEPWALIQAETTLAQAAKTAGVPPLVSVILPTRDRPEFLTRALTSVEQQTYQNIELIVINDGGTPIDHLLPASQPGLTVISIRLATPMERSAARNAGLRVARGLYLAYLDDDDWYEPTHLETLVSTLQQTDCLVAYADARRVHEVRHGDRYVAVRTEAAPSSDYNLAALLICNSIPILSLMHHRRCLEQAGYFDETLQTHEDWDLWIRFALITRFCHVPQTTGNISWRQDGSSTTSARQTDIAQTAARIHNRYARYTQGRAEIVEGQAQLRQFLHQRARHATAPTCSIIVPVCNGVDETKRCLANLVVATEDVAYELIIVDQGSSDGTAEFLKTITGNIRVLHGTPGSTWGQACNHGAAVARGEYLVFLHQSLQPLKGWLSALLREATSNPTSDVVGSKIITQHRTIWHAGLAVTPSASLPQYRHRGAPADHPEVSTRQEVQAVSGACALIRKTAFTAAGGFEETFHALADLDLCLRIRVHSPGHSVVYQPASTVLGPPRHWPDSPATDHADSVARFAERWDHQALRTL